MFHHRISDGDIRKYASLDTGLLLKTKGRKEIYSSEPEPKFPTGVNSDILGVTKSNSPQRCTSGSAFNPCALQKRPQVKEMRDYSGYRKCKIKTIKVLSSYNNALCDSSKLCFTTINPGDMGTLDILHKEWRNSQI